MNKYINYAAKKALHVAPVYKAARALARTEVVDTGFVEARRALMKLRPYTEPALPNGRPAWPEVPEVDVSVILPCYNVEKYLSECLDSVLTQETEFSFEVICVDDGSPDSCGRIIDEYAARDSRVAAVHQENRGCAGARNHGIEIARGGVLMFVDPDDVIESGSMQLLMDEYMKGGCDLVTGNYGTMNEDGTNFKPKTVKRAHGAPWGRVFDRELWRDLSFPEGNVYEDTVGAYCIIPRCNERYLEQCVYRLRKNPGSVTHLSVKSYKGIDTYWVVECMLSWCRKLDIALDQRLYDQTLRQFGPLARGRVAALNDKELKIFFACCCGCLAAVEEFSGMHTSMSGAWRDVEASLRGRDFSLWKLACLGA